MPNTSNDYSKPEQVYLKVWDTTGKQDMQDRVKIFYQNAQVALIVFSID